MTPDEPTRHEPTRHEHYLRRRAEVLRPVPGGLAGGDGALVVLLPGLGGLAELEFLAPMLARRHRVLALELPDAPFEVAAARLRSALPAEPFTLVGFSVGALLALALADTAEALVLGAGWLEPEPRLARYLRIRAQLSEPSELDELLHGAPVTAGRLLASATGVELGGATIPSLVLAGERDALIPREHSELLFGSLEDARYHRLDAGHALLAERPAEVLALIESFLLERSAATR